MVIHKQNIHFGLTAVFFISATHVYCINMSQMITCICYCVKINIFHKSEIDDIILSVASEVTVDSWCVLWWLCVCTACLVCETNVSLVWFDLITEHYLIWMCCGVEITCNRYGWVTWYEMTLLVCYLHLHWSYELKVCDISRQKWRCTNKVRNKF